MRYAEMLQGVVGKGRPQTLRDVAVKDFIMAFRTEQENQYSNLVDARPYTPTSPLPPELLPSQTPPPLSFFGLHLPSPPTSPPPPQQPPHHSRPREHNVKSLTKAYQPAENTPYLAPSSEVASAQQQTFTSVLNVFHDAQTNSFNQEALVKCEGCQLAIEDLEYTQAEGKSWHLHHFICHSCSLPLAGKDYTLEEGTRKCVECEQRPLICSGCGECLGPREPYVSLGGTNWHARNACYRCSQCREPLIGRKCSMQGGKPTCSSRCARRSRLENRGMPSGENSASGRES